MATTVEVLAESFKAWGTPFLVGHPGGESVELMAAARAAGMRFILMKQEVAAALMAATWGAITGAPGVCFATRGPGATNMVNGVAHAFLDRAPLLAITDRYPSGPHEVGLRQRLDQRAIYAPIVKWGTTLDATIVRQQVARAHREATALPPGPVHFDLPHSEPNREAGEMVAEPPLAAGVVHPMPDRAGLKPLIERIDAARKPVLLAGLGVLWDSASGELVDLAEQLGAPVLTTAKCKGVIPEDHPLRAGCIIGGLIERKLVAQADLIVTVGLDAVELQPKAWPYTTPLVALANAPMTDAVIPAMLEVPGNLKHILAGLAEWCGAGAGWGEKAARAFRQDVTDALDTPGAGLTPQRVMEVARGILPRETIASSDSGASRLLVVQKWQSYGPHEFLSSNGLATMGYAIPGALGARLVWPDRPVVAFVGDGGFMMAVAELQTSVRENLPIIIVVFDDQEIGLIRVKQEIKGLERFGVDLGGIDWEKLAQAFGADGVTVDTENGLQDALGAALGTGRTTIIAARINPSGYVEQFNALREL